MNYFLDNWGSFASALGVGVSLLGLWAALVAVKRAGKAREAADAAQTASQEARATVTRVITGVDLVRAIALIQRLKLLHRDGKWEASSGHYQDLRHMLVDIGARHPEPSEELRQTLQEATAQISALEMSVDRALRDNGVPRGAANFNRDLNAIQEHLEGISSSTHFSVPEVGG